MSTLEINKDKEVISNIDYNKQYRFKIFFKMQYPKLIIDAVFFNRIIGVNGDCFHYSITKFFIISRYIFFLIAAIFFCKYYNYYDTRHLQTIQKILSNCFEI